MQLAEAIDAWVSAHDEALSPDTKRDIGDIVESAQRCGYDEVECHDLREPHRLDIIAEADGRASISANAVGQFLAIVVDWAAEQAPPAIIGHDVVEASDPSRVIDLDDGAATTAEVDMTQALDDAEVVALALETASESHETPEPVVEDADADLNEADEASTDDTEELTTEDDDDHDTSNDVTQPVADEVDEVDDDADEADDTDELTAEDADDHDTSNDVTQPVADDADDADEADDDADIEVVVGTAEDAGKASLLQTLSGGATGQGESVRVMGEPDELAPSAKANVFSEVAATPPEPRKTDWITIGLFVVAAIAFAAVLYIGLTDAFG